MPRKRTNGLPPYVYRGRSAYDLHIYNGKGLARQVIRLCDGDIPMSEIWRTYELFHSQNIMNLNWLLMEYQKSVLFHKNATRTIKYQSEMMQRIINLNSV
jgi:hypothetical protein